MARIDYGIMGGFSGKVGTVVGYYWNGKPCMRAYKRYVNNPRTEAQQEHRTLFKQEVQLAAKMRWAVTTTMTEAAREAGMTSYNLFVHMNQHAFTMSDNRLVVDYSRLMLSMGDVASAVPTTACFYMYMSRSWSGVSCRQAPTGARSASPWRCPTSSPDTTPTSTSWCRPTTAAGATRCMPARLLWMKWLEGRK